jgi:TonB family protein
MTLLQFILVQVNLVALFAIYMLFASKKGHFTFNRWFLILGPALAILLPFVRVDSTSATVTSVLLPVVEVLESAEPSVSSAMSWGHVIILIGTCVVLLLFGLSLVRLLKRKNATFLGPYKGASVYKLESSNSTTHSIFNRIYLHPDHSAFQDIVLEHEYAHCKHHHTLDLLLMALYKALFWFNPVIYKWAKQMQLNHEYLADAHVLSQGISTKDYGSTLLAVHFSNNGGTLIHAFNKPSTLRKRIVHFNHQNKFNMKHLLLIPAVFAIAFATTSMASTKSFIPNSKPSSSLETVVEGDDEITQPEYPGGQEALMKYLATNLNYPEALKKEKAEGKVFVQFTVASDGSIQNVQVVRSSGYTEMDTEAVRVVRGMEKWQPGTKNGKAVNTKMTLPFNFKL